MKAVDEHLLAAEGVLRANDTGEWICPARGLYPHQWLWDTCLIAIGLRHINAARAAREIGTLLSAQWDNGMVPHMVFSPHQRNWFASRLWGTQRCADSPRHILTSGITQPPLIATAALKLADTLARAEIADEQQFLEGVYPKLLAYHQWLYRQRDPEGDGLVALIHPWETGMDNTPDWMELLDRLPRPWWQVLISRLGLTHLLGLARRDHWMIDSAERMSTDRALVAANLIHRYRQQCYDYEAIYSHAPIEVESLFFNAILIRANRDLETIANRIGAKIPNQTRSYFRRAEQGLDKLYDERTRAYQARNVAGKYPMRTLSISSIMPLYTGAISDARAREIIDLLRDDTKFWSRWPVPSVPIHSAYFDQKLYWSGPTWINTNWFIIEGLKLYGYDQEAKYLRTKTLRMIEQAGFYEYFSPLDGKGYGIDNFSWTAALYIDLNNN